MGSALLDMATLDTAASLSPDALRLQVAERLAAHRDRRRRPRAEAAAVLSPAPTKGGASSARSARIAAAVAERYARSPSYRAFLEAEAEKALQQARAAAEIAELNVRAVAEAQRQLMDALDEARSEDGAGVEAFEEDAVYAGAVSAVAGGEQIVSVYDEAVQEKLRELTLWPELEAESSPRPSIARRQPATQKAAPNRSHPNASTATNPSQTRSAAPLFAQAAPHATAPVAGLTVRLYEDGDGAVRTGPAEFTGRPAGVSAAAASARRATRHEERNDAEALALDEEIAFRQSPVFDGPATPPQPLPANLIEFPRQLIASRKARPRYAEGPLLDEAGAVAGAGQLRIFEVDPAEISTTPASTETAAPQWTSIWLDGPGRTPAGRTAAEADAAVSLGRESESEAAVHALLPASLGRRVAAGAVNGVVVLTGFVIFAAVFAMVAGRLSAMQAAGPLDAGGLARGALGQLASLAARTGMQPGTAAVASAVVLGALYLVYQALFFWLSGATPGMRVARIALCTFTDENPSRGAVRRRVPAVLLSACALGLGFAWAILDEDRLTWHDRVTRMYQRGY